jgi:hypothetical protein
VLADRALQAFNRVRCGDDGKLPLIKRHNSTLSPGLRPKITLN